MAKRVNSRFLIILGSVVAAMAVAFILVTAVVRKNAASLVREGDAKFDRGDYKGAVDSYSRAHAREQSNVEALTKLGKAFDAMTGVDPENLLRARGAWNEAATLNPRYEPVLRLLADTYWDQVQVSPTSMDIYRLVRESHARLLAAMPSNTPDAERATIEARRNLGTLAPWLRMNAPVDPKEVRDSVAALESLAPKDPANAEIATAISLSYVKWANEAKDAGKEDDKIDSLKKAEAQIRTSLKGQEKNPAMQLAAFQLYNQVLLLATEDSTKKEIKANVEKALGDAVLAVKPEDQVYVDVMVQAAGKALVENRKVDADNIYRDILSKRPNDPRARLIAAKGIAADKANREKAIALFSQPITNSPERGAKALRNREWEVRMLLELVGLRMEKYQDSKDEERAAITKQIDQDFLRLKTLLPADAVPYLKIRARYQQLKGDGTGAIQLYARAVELSGTPNTPEEYDLMSELALAYLRARPPQTGAARKLLEPIAKKFPTHIPTRLLLATIALDENDLDEAQKHADDLQQQTADHPVAQVQNLQATIIARKGNDPAKVDAFLNNLRENTREERLIKAQIAGMVLNRVPEATRLLKQNVSLDSKDMQSLEGLIRTLLAEKKNDEARQAVADAAKADPDNKDLKKAIDDLDDLLKQQKLDPAEQYKSAQARVTTDKAGKPKELALALGDLARRYQKPAEAEAQYRVAEGMDKDKVDTDVIGRLYAVLMEQKRYADAKPYLEKLSKANADFREGYALQARYSLVTGDVAEAIKAAQVLTQRWSEFGESWLLLGQAQQAGGKYAEAVNQFAAARQRQGKNAEAIKGQIECYYATGYIPEARAAIQEGRQLFPNEELFRELELGHEVTYGDPEKAIPTREANLKDAPDDKPRLLVLVEAYGRAGLIKYANDLPKRQMYLGKARKLMEDGVKKWPDDPKMVGGLADVLMAIGDVNAGEKLLVGYSVSPKGKESYQSQVMLANYYMRGGKPDDAVLAMRAALAQSNGDKEVRRLLIAMLAQRKQFTEALAALNEAPKTEPLFVRQRIEVLLAAGMRPEAETAIRAAMKDMPQIASELRILLATLYIDLNKLDEASTEIEKELAVNPNNAAGYYYRAMVKLKRTDRDVVGAMADLNKVRQIDPNNVPSRLLMADAQNASGAMQQAVSELEDALHLAPLNVEVRKRLVDNYARRNEFNEVLRLTKEAEATPAIDSDPVWPLAASRALSQQKPPDFTAAKAAMARAIAKAPKEGNAVYYQELLTLLHKAGDDAELLRVTDQMIQAKPPRTDWWIYQSRGMARAAAKDTAGALVEFDRALADADKTQNAKAAEAIVESMAEELGTDQALARAQSRAETDIRWKAVVASIYQQRADFDHAVKQADEIMVALAAPVTAGAAPLDPNVKLTALRTAASIYHFAKPPEADPNAPQARPKPAVLGPQFDKAKNTYLEILKVAPRDYFALNNIAVLLSEDQIPPDPAGAKVYSEKAYNIVRRMQPMVSRVIDTHGWVLVQAGDVDEGLPLLRSVVDNDPFAEARYHLGEAYLKKGRGDEAMQELVAARDELKIVIQHAAEPSAFDQKLLHKVEEALDRAVAAQNRAQAQ